MSSREIYDAQDGIAERKSYGFRDPVVKNVVDKFVNRSNLGYDKYGRTLDDERRNKHKDFLFSLKVYCHCESLAKPCCDNCK